MEVFMKEKDSDVAATAQSTADTGASSSAAGTLNPQPVRERPISTGMTTKHELIMSLFAKLNDTVMIWRPINPEAAVKLDSPAMPYKGKALNVKAKSSEFGPIAGEIPVDARLSKLGQGLFTSGITMEEIDQLNKELAALTKKNEQVLEAERQQYLALLQSTNKTDVADINNRFLLTKMPKLDQHQREIYYFLDQQDNPVTAESNKQVPLFAAFDKDENIYYQYNYGSQKFEHPIQRQETFLQLYKPMLVEIMAYRWFGRTLDDQIKCPITADYDELVSASGKRFPLLHNEKVQVKISRRIMRLLVISGAPLAAPTQFTDEDRNRLKGKITELVAELILSYELKEKQENRDLMLSAQMGAVNDWQWAMKTHLKHETDSATNHGPEINNPFPEPFVEDGNYPVFVPKGEFPALQNEEAILGFINQKRNEGYPLLVNPKWGWELNKERELAIPTGQRFDWTEIHSKMKKLACEIQQLEAGLEQFTNCQQAGDLSGDHPEWAKIMEEWEKTLASLRDPYQAKARTEYSFIQTNMGQEEEAIELAKKTLLTALIEDRRRKLKQLRPRFKHEQEIIDLKVNIERLKLEPEIIYCQDDQAVIQQYHLMKHAEHGLAELRQELSSAAQEYLKDLDQLEQTFIQEVSELVRTKERAQREEQQQKLESELEQSNEEFVKCYRERSLVYQVYDKLKLKGTEEIKDKAVEGPPKKKQKVGEGSSLSRR